MIFDSFQIRSAVQDGPLSEKAGLSEIDRCIVVLVVVTPHHRMSKCAVAAQHRSEAGSGLQAVWFGRSCRRMRTGEGLMFSLNIELMESCLICGQEDRVEEGSFLTPQDVVSHQPDIVAGGAPSQSVFTLHCSLRLELQTLNSDVSDPGEEGGHWPPLEQVHPLQASSQGF